MGESRGDRAPFQGYCTHLTETALSSPRRTLSCLPGTHLEFSFPRRWLEGRASPLGSPEGVDLRAQSICPPLGLGVAWAGSPKATHCEAGPEKYQLWGRTAQQRSLSWRPAGWLAGWFALSAGPHLVCLEGEKLRDRQARRENRVAIIMLGSPLPSSKHQQKLYTSRDTLPAQTPAPSRRAGRASWAAGRQRHLLLRALPSAPKFLALASPRLLPGGASHVLQASVGGGLALQGAETTLDKEGTDQGPGDP